MKCDEINKNELFEAVDPVKALSVMALPTVGSQVIALLYNLADTPSILPWFSAFYEKHWSFYDRFNWRRSFEKAA